MVVVVVVVDAPSLSAPDASSISGCGAAQVTRTTLVLL